MNKILIGTSILLFMFSFSLLAEPQPTERKDSLYTQKVGDGALTLFYIVDTHAKFCFVSPGGGAALTSVSCAQLKNREVWQKIITW